MIIMTVIIVIVLVILGINDYSKIKPQEWLRLYVPGEPITELIKFGWIIFFLGQETGDTNMLFPKPSLHDYEKTLQLRLSVY